MADQLFRSRAALFLALSLSSSMLTPAWAADDRRAPSPVVTRLNCSGTEPFWSLETTGAQVKLSLPSDGPTGLEERVYFSPAQINAAGFVTGTAMEISGWRVGSASGKKSAEKISVSAFKAGEIGCVYTRTDEAPTFEVLVHSGATLLLGCCSLTDAPPKAPPPPKPPIDFAKIEADVAKIKALLPAGTELAGAYHRGETAIVLWTGEDYLNVVRASYVFSDFNKDGIQDLAVATEAAPADDDFGERNFLIFLSDRALGDQAGLQLFRQNKQVVMGASDGGLFGDPYNGMTISPKRTITLSHFGGSADRWGFKQSFQYRYDDKRGYDFYLIGTVRESEDTRVGRRVVSDTDLLTGERIVTRSRPGRANVVTKSKVAVKPLKKLTETTVGF